MTYSTTRTVGGALEPAGRALEPSGRALEPAGRVSEQARGAPEPDGRALEPTERASELAGRALEPARRPGANWEGQVRGRRGRREKKNNGALLVCGGTIGHRPLLGRCPKTRCCRRYWIFTGANPCLGSRVQKLKMNQSPRQAFPQV